MSSNVIKAVAALGLLVAAAAGVAQARDRDNNPPGWRGGPGTNWENPRGPVGGPGASPDRRGWRYDRDGNPPGPRGGPGTNWENPPGPVGGPGASPDRVYWRPGVWFAPGARYFWSGRYYYWHPYRACWFFDADWNPPGPRGGPGTNWENPPGPAGGPGASPNRNICR